MVEDRPIMSVNTVSQLQSSTFGQPTLQLGLSAIVELLVRLGAGVRVDITADADQLADADRVNIDTETDRW